MGSYIKRWQKDLNRARKDKELRYSNDVLEGLSHQIGYATGVQEQIRKTLNMLKISDKEFFDERRKMDDNLKELKKQLGSIIKSSK